MNRKSITDMVCNVFNPETDPDSGVCVTGGRVPLHDPKLAVLGMAPRRLAELRRMIEFQEKVVIKMINGDPEEFLPLPPKRVRLRVVK